MKSQVQATPLTPTSGWRFRLRQARNLMLVAMTIVVVAHTAGLPHLRWEYGYHGRRDSPVIQWGVYAGPNGLVRLEAGDRPSGCPLVVFLQPKRPLWGLVDLALETRP